VGENSSIQWTDHTFNPWRGCVKVSAGCKNCYAEQSTPVRVARSRGLETWGADAARIPASEALWREPLKWNEEAKAAGAQARVFTASLSDFFEGRGDLDEMRARLFALIALTPWLLLTKRPENMLRLVPPSWATAWPANVWAGTSIEDQAMADKRIPHLLEVPAVVRFLSMEPLLEAVSLRAIRWPASHRGYVDALTGETEFEEVRARAHATPPARRLDWIIIGGESGSKARPFDPAWARFLVNQASAAGVPAFVKQLGARPVLRDRYDVSEERFAELDAAGWDEHHGPPDFRDGHGGDMAEWPADLQVREFPASAVST
jgi:protein gp37